MRTLAVRIFHRNSFVYTDGKSQNSFAGTKTKTSIITFRGELQRYHYRSLYVRLCGAGHCSDCTHDTQV